MSDKPVTVSLLQQALARLPDAAEKDQPARLRLERTDGTVLLGELNMVAPTSLFLLDAESGTLMEVPLDTIRSVSVAERRVGRAMIVASVFITVVTSVLVTYVVWRGVDYIEGGITSLFLFVFSVFAGFLSLLLNRRWVKDWLTLWRPL